MMHHHVTTEFSGFGILFVIIPVLAMLWLLTRLLGCRRRRPPLLLLLLAVPLLITAFGRWGVSRRETGLIADNYIPHSKTTAVASLEAPPADPPQATSAAAPPLDKLWNELHPVKIDLSEETAETQAEEEQEPPRPAWVDRPPRQVGEVYQRSVSAGPWQDVTNCYRELQEKLYVIVKKRIEKLAADDPVLADVAVPSLAELGIDAEYVLSELCTDKYVEAVKGPDFEGSKKVYALLEFTDADDQRLLAHWKEYLRRQRIGEVGAGATTVLAGLALVYGLLKVNLAGVGRGAKRLFARPNAAIIAVAALILAV